MAVILEHSSLQNKRTMNNWLLLLLCLLANTLLLAQKKIPVTKLLQDYDYLRTLLEEEHQGLSYYTTPQKTKQYLDSLRATIKDPLTQEAFYRKILAATVITNEGHTGVSLPKKWRKKYKKNKLFLPLDIQFAGEEAVIVGYYGEISNSIERGDKLLSINGKSIHEIMETFQQYLVTDGFNVTSLYEWSSWSFALYYYLLYEKNDHFEIKIERFKDQKYQKINLTAIAATEIKASNNQLPNIKLEEIFNVVQLDRGIAYLQVPSFSTHKNFERFYKEAFAQFKAWNTKHLIIDIQHNGGGEEGNENLLASYLIRAPFQKYKAVLVKEAWYKEKKRSKDFVEDGWSIRNGQPCRGAFTLQSDYYSTLKYQKPDSTLLYEGQVYVLTGGETFSGGAEFASMLKMKDRAIFVGEETGGVYEGNVSGYTNVVKLPCTRIAVHIPLVHFQINVEPSLRGHGVLPDYKVINTQATLAKGENAKLQFALELIKGKI